MDAETKLGSDLPGDAARVQSILDVSARVFVARGYSGTALTDIAHGAGVNVEEVRERVGDKAEILNRIIDAAVHGGFLSGNCEWGRTVIDGDTLECRIHAYVSGSCDMMRRAACLMRVAAAAERAEPDLAEAAQSRRLFIHERIAFIWHRMDLDQLLHPDVVLDRVIATASTLGQPEVYVAMTRSVGWTTRVYGHWLERTWLHLATTPNASSWFHE
ncbi:TetR/AcrR family transcriptional regulator [Nocardia sp. CY41]|uniref:TetR/AcrR family transcriptional regulator n=1 Tax=Nocardia sp. CY41 TaxID=2608686 RepID=UPI00135B1776|nr:TetR/AcrR family transcriptional regulator [Nocardia sp. CY41]